MVIVEVPVTIVDTRDDMKSVVIVGKVLSRKKVPQVAHGELFIGDVLLELEYLKMKMSDEDFSTLTWGATQRFARLVKGNKVKVVARESEIRVLSDAEVVGELL